MARVRFFTYHSHTAAAGLRIPHALLPLAFALLVCTLVLSGCAPGHKDEIIAGATIPVPLEMKKIDSDLNFDLGQGQKGEQVTFRGDKPREEIIRFYQEALPARNWKPDVRLGEDVAGYGFIRGDKSLMIRVVEEDEDSSVLILIAKDGEFSPS